MQLGPRKKCREQREQHKLQEQMRLEETALNGWTGLGVLARKEGSTLP
jgi:hypothetical protein